MNWLWFIPIMLVMVVIHEFGHFITARMFGMKVHEFGIGFPPKVWSKKTKDGMEWSINALPIGGFVRIEGENGDSDDPNSFGKKPTWQRAIVLAAGPFMNLVLAFVIYFLLSLGGKDVPAGPVGISRVEPNSPAAAAGLKSGDVILKVNGTSVESTKDVSVETRLNRSQPLEYTIQRGTQTFAVTLNGRQKPPDGEGAIGVVMGTKVSSGLQIAVNNTSYGLQDGDKIISIDSRSFADNIQYMDFLRTQNKDSIDVVIQRSTNGQSETLTKSLPVKLFAEYIYKDSDASRMGMLSGAQILSINDQKVNNAATYESILKANHGQQVKITYINPKEKTERVATITANYTDNSATANRSPRPLAMVDGVFLTQYIHKNLSPLEWVGESWNQTIYAITLIPRSIQAVINGSVGFESFAGPVGMAQITDQVIDNGGFLATLSLMALLSVNLGIVNILPLPALDGGRLVFVFIEMISRRRVPPDKEGLVHFAGMVLLLTLMLAFTWQDVSRLITGAGFN